MMVFVDGENLAIRFGAGLDAQPIPSHVLYEPNVAVWSSWLNVEAGGGVVVRRYYYTSCPGDDQARSGVELRLRAYGIHAPRVFHKPRGKRAKRVDISLATDMLTHVHRGNYDVGILVAGDEDYVPLVEAVKAEGAQVAVWFIGNGLSAGLRHSADHFFDLEEVLAETDSAKLQYIHL
jgi:uncharacterized LabA/DUF88 family protein